MSLEDASNLSFTESGMLGTAASDSAKNKVLQQMDLTIEGSDGGEGAGRNIVGNCDFNADGEADLFISAKTGTADGGSGSGIIYFW